MAKAFAKLTRKARRMAKSQSKKQSVQPAKVQKMAVLSPPRNIHAKLQCLQSPRVSWPCAATHAQSENFGSNVLMYSGGSSAGIQENVVSSFQAFQTPVSLASAFAPLTPDPIFPPVCFLSPLLGSYKSYTPLSTAFLLGATWAIAAKPLASNAWTPSRA